MVRQETLFCTGAWIEMEEEKERLYVPHLPASLEFISVGYPVPLSSETALEASSIAVRCLPPPSYYLSLNINILKVNSLNFTH